jgi:hypothetical protein
VSLAIRQRSLLIAGRKSGRLTTVVTKPQNFRSKRDDLQSGYLDRADGAVITSYDKSTPGGKNILETISTISA